ncbi:MAG: DNA-directed RNA polymerase subunit omega [Bdellovibrionales bacterium]|nr:DNA-directed RNA polymerase subunit omega [Bdellovibrionales bacterium]
MARVTVEDCLEKVHNRFALVLLVAKRAKQLMKGSHSTLAAKNNKNVVVSLREVASGNVYFDSDETLGSQESQIVADLNK